MESIIKLENAIIQIEHNQVLKDVNLEIANNEFIYLIGKTGSGKSSLLRTLYGDLPLAKGSGEVAGFDLAKIKKGKIPFLRRKLGIVFQDFQLLSDRTVQENLIFVMKATGWKNKSEISKKIDRVLERVGLETKGFKYPHQLSGGEQQRVAIARALVNDPDLILADEPTGNLDPETSENIMNLLIEISKNGRAILMATHDFKLIEKFPARILKCENGTLISAKPSAA
jgi:cell division transport system ATP-binding protein|tara:strand:- start:1479 stop:2159 length:681 start_codon:yes stop_codon:yes gene_type:complete